MGRLGRVVWLTALLIGWRVILCDGAWAADQTLKLGGPVFPPFYEAVDGQVRGAMVDKLAKIANGAGFKVVAELFPAARLVQNLISGESELTMLVRNPALDDSGALIRSPQPVGELLLILYSHGAPAPLIDRQDLIGKSIAVMRGYGYGSLRAWMDLPANRVTLTEVNNFEAAIRLVADGRTPFALLYDVNYQAGVTALGAAPTNVYANIFQRVPAFLYLNKKAAPDPAATMRALMASYRALLGSGAVDGPEGLDAPAEGGEATQ